MLRGLFIAIFGVNTLCLFVGTKVVQVLPREKSEKASLAMCKLAWLATILCSPWMKFIAEPTDEEEWQSVAKDEKLMANERPLLVMGNHQCFADAVFYAATTPFSVVTKCKTYMGAHLFKMPVLSSICKACGHFPVFFKSSEVGKFQTDVEKMKPVEEKVKTWLDQGGGLCFYPEGQTNPTPDQVNPFRFGGIKQALEYDAHIVFKVFVGNSEVWPRKSTLGGYPGVVRHGVRDVTPNGCKAFLAELRESDLSAEEKEMNDVQLLATRLHSLMQGMYDELKAKSESSGREHSN